MVIQFHSPRDQLFADTPDSFELGCPWLVVAQFQVRLFPEATPVPNAVPIDDKLHTPAEERLNPLTSVCYSPSNTNCRGWDDKGYHPTTQAFKRLHRSRIPFADYVVTDTPLRKVLAIKRQCDICIGEVMTGSYHLSSLEALSQGLATIAGLDTKTIDALEKVTGTRKHPWIVTGPGGLYSELYQLIMCPDFLKAKQIESRQYMERYWDPMRLADIYGAAYEQA